MSHRIFIDGQAGTTGLEIHTRLRGQPDLELLEIDPQQRKDPAARAALLNAADVVVLCLPDDAARDAVARIDDPDVRILDASSAHRTAPGWVYGLPELAATQREAIRSASRVANPGCYPTGFLLLLRPLVDAGAVPAEARLTIHALSGYSGGGRSLVDRYAAAAGDELLAPRSYGLSLDHKHRPEMRALAGLAHAPLFSPMVGPFERGMLVHVPLPADRRAPGSDARDLQRILAEHYAGEPNVVVHPVGARDQLDGGFLDPRACNGTNRVDLMIFGADASAAASADAGAGDDVLLVARLDNLGKGAGGAAVQNLNLMLGRDEQTGLEAPAQPTDDARACA